MYEFKPKSIYDMSLVTAALRPSGASYRESLMKKEIHKNISPMIDELLKNNYGFLIYQCDVTKFLQQICGLSGSEADNVRRAIARKQMDRLEKALPKIQDGYVEKSGKPREEALQELQEYIQILIDASSYMFGYNHSIAYCLIGYLCAYLRYYYPAEFILSYLNNADNEDDIVNGYELSRIYHIDILPPRFRHSIDKYVLDKETNQIYKGVESIKFLNKECSLFLYSLRNKSYNTFIDLLINIAESKDEQGRAYVNSRQLEILIKLQYFEEFGHNKKLMVIYEHFKNLYGKKVIAKNRIDELNLPSYVFDIDGITETDKQYRFENMNNVLYLIESNTENQSFDIEEQVIFEKEALGYINATYNVDKNVCYVLDVNQKYTPKLTLYSLKTGKSITCKINKTLFKNSPLKEGNIIRAIHFEKKPKQIFSDGKWIMSDEKEWWCNGYTLTTIKEEIKSEI